MSGADSVYVKLVVMINEFFNKQKTKSKLIGSHALNRHRLASLVTADIIVYIHSKCKK